jgi:serine phosphatase RsbU (regulator of sigma subunit)
MDPANNEFGDGRLLEALDALQGEDAAGTIRGVLDRLDRFSAGGRNRDDVTCLTLRIAA